MLDLNHNAVIILWNCFVQSGANSDKIPTPSSFPWAAVSHGGRGQPDEFDDPSFERYNLTTTRVVEWR